MAGSLANDREISTSRKENSVDMGNPRLGVRRRLQAGERIRARDFPGSAARATWITALDVLYAVSLCVFWSPVGVTFVLILPFFIYQSAVEWGTYLRCAVQLSVESIDFWDWRNRLHQIRLDDIVALRWLRRGPLALCWTSANGDRPRWTFLDRLASDLGEATRDEILSRCELIEGFGGIWRRTAEAVPPPLPWWREW